jgi:hypothetical protein
VNYDRLHHEANYDSLVRQLLGQAAFDMALEFKLSTLKDNFPLLSEELLEAINAVIVRHGGGCIKKKRRHARDQSRYLVPGRKRHFFVRLQRQTFFR